MTLFALTNLLVPSFFAPIFVTLIFVINDVHHIIYIYILVLKGSLVIGIAQDVTRTQYTGVKPFFGNMVLLSTTHVAN